MYKVLIVDDEKYIRDRITQFFPWEDVGFEVIGAAENGKEALEMVKVHKPHAVLTDVLMPEMTGIELAKEIESLYPETRVIVLSAYDDFKYAQEAIQYGVKGYLLKPLSKNDFLDTFNKLKEELNREIEISEINIQKSELITEELFVLELINGSKFEKGFNKEVLTGDCRVVIFPLDKFFREHSIYSYRQIISEQSAVFWKGFNSPFLFYGNSIIVILNGELASSKKNVELILKKFISLLSQCLKEVCDAKDTFVAGVGSVAMDIDQIKRSYNEAIYAYSYKYFYDHDSIVFYEELPANYIHEVYQKNQSPTLTPPNSIETRLMEAILLREVKDITLIMDEYFEDLKQKMGLKIADVRGACTELVIVLMFHLKEKGYEPYSIELQKVLENIYMIESFSELKNWLKTILETISLEIMDPNAYKGNHYVLKAKEYVNTHYKDKITLLEMSHILFLHPSYFSAIFKEETGQNFIDYVNEVRVEKAADLLRNDEYRIKDITHIVGFQSDSYFNRVFKKIKKVSPLQYKKKFSR
ncbi:response regulator [Lederbergia wuyishanensis]|uniref:YesN/AraC family two-component response regulator n=1 Tax=Lederbergia wuyishanensis TaxID=1347903 RepID=A0ABU0D5L3_9BACI|nr:response regulator [Lederbergia wuyishanensis]MCJ8009824.1 response regulator [Lederbergia wuyishanensis]MDQ0343680.1 YesN/AraC family two-component response regulator [Lederbergia wuyishanensis]